MPHEVVAQLFGCEGVVEEDAVGLFRQGRKVPFDAAERFTNSLLVLIRVLISGAREDHDALRSTTRDDLGDPGSCTAGRARLARVGRRAPECEQAVQFIMVRVRIGAAREQNEIDVVERLPELQETRDGSRLRCRFSGASHESLQFFQKDLGAERPRDPCFFFVMNRRHAWFSVNGLVNPQSALLTIPGSNLLVNQKRPRGRGLFCGVNLFSQEQRSKRGNRGS